MLTWSGQEWALKSGRRDSMGLGSLARCGEKTRERPAAVGRQLAEGAAPSPAREEEVEGRLYPVWQVSEAGPPSSGSLRLRVSAGTCLGQLCAGRVAPGQTRTRGPAAGVDLRSAVKRKPRPRGLPNKHAVLAPAPLLRRGPAGGGRRRGLPPGGGLPGGQEARVLQRQRGPCGCSAGPAPRPTPGARRRAP